RPRPRDPPVHRPPDRRGRGLTRRCGRRDHRVAPARGGAMTMIRTQPIPDSGEDTHGAALEPLLFELARPGRHGRHVRADATPDVPAKFQRTVPLRLPELTEPQVVRHFTHLAQLNYSIDTGMYP